MADKGAGGDTPTTKKSIWGLVIRVVLALVLLGVAGGIYVNRQARLTKEKNQAATLLVELKQAQKLALDAVVAHDEVKAVLGDDVKDAGDLDRQGKGELNRQNTTITFSIAGSKGKGTVKAQTGQKDGVWQILAPIQVQPASGKAIEVPKPDEASPEIEL